MWCVISRAVVPVFLEASVLYARVEEPAYFKIFNQVYM